MNSSNYNKLVLACKNNDLNQVQTIINVYKEDSIPDNVSDLSELTPIIWACNNNSLVVVELLLASNYSQIGYNNKATWSALMWACANKSIEIVKLLLATGKAQPEYQTNDGWSALMVACCYNEPSIVDLLLRTGNAHPEYKNNMGDSALIISCTVINKYTVDIVKMLIETGESHPEYQTVGGESAIILACRNTNLELIKLLIFTNQAHPEYKDSLGFNAFNYGNINTKLYMLKCIRVYNNLKTIIRKIKLIVKVVNAFRNYDKGKPYSCEMFYLMGLDGMEPHQNIEVTDIKTGLKIKINIQQLKYMKMGYEEYLKYTLNI